MDSAGNAPRCREQMFDGIWRQAGIDLYVATRAGSTEATAAFQDAKSQMLEEWQKEKPGEMNSYVEELVSEAAAETVDKMVADTLAANYATELEELRTKGTLSDDDAEYRLVAYCVGLSTAAEVARSASVGPSGYTPVEEESVSAAEKLFWNHAFHIERNDQAPLPLDPLGNDVHDAVVGIAAVRRHIRLRPCADRWADLRRVLTTTRGGVIFHMDEVNGWVDAPHGPTLLLRRNDPHTLVVAVAATKTLSDYVRNCELELVPPPAALGLPDSMRVHAGWGAVATDLVARDIFAKIDAHRRPDEPLRVVWAGHSLGGAVATLLAAAAACRASGEARALAVTAARGAADDTGGAPPAATRIAAAARSVLVTFGAPRVGDAATQAVVAALTTHTSVVAEADTVPQAPAYTSLRRHLISPRTAAAAGARSGGGSAASPLQPDASYVPAFADHHWLLRRSPALVVLAEGVAAQRFVFPRWAWGFARYHRLTCYLELLVNHYDDLVRDGAPPAEPAAIQ